MWRNTFSLHVDLKELIEVCKDSIGLQQLEKAPDFSPDRTNHVTNNQGLSSAAFSCHNLILCDKIII